MVDYLSPAQIQQFGPPTLENLEHVWEVARITAAFNYAGVTIMIWDMLLTMQMEVCLSLSIVGYHGLGLTGNPTPR
jgi:hypothetical protein